MVEEDSQQTLDLVKRGLDAPQPHECLLMTPEEDARLRSGGPTGITILAINDVSISGDKAEVTVAASLGYSMRGLTEYEYVLAREEHAWRVVSSKITLQS